MQQIPPQQMINMTTSQIQQPLQNHEPDSLEQKAQDLILMTGNKGPRRWRQQKKEYLKHLEQDNSQLKSLVVEIQQHISALQAQNDVLRDQLAYFQSCLAQAAPLVFQQGNVPVSHN